jgi:hypothetical protein
VSTKVDRNVIRLRDPVAPSWLIALDQFRHVGDSAAECLAARLPRPVVLVPLHPDGAQVRPLGYEIAVTGGLERGAQHREHRADMTRQRDPNPGQKQHIGIERQHHRNRAQV